MPSVAVKDLVVGKKYYMMGYSSANEWGQYASEIVSNIRNEEPQNETTSLDGMYNLTYKFEGKAEETILLRGSTMFEEVTQVGGKKGGSKKRGKKRNSHKRRNTRR